MIQYSWFVVHYAMLLPDNLLDTTTAALRALIIFILIIHELVSNQQKSRPHMYTTVHAVSVKALGACRVMCLLVGPTLYYQMNVVFP